MLIDFFISTIAFRYDVLESVKEVKVPTEKKSRKDSEKMKVKKKEKSEKERKIEEKVECESVASRYRNQLSVLSTFSIIYLFHYFYHSRTNLHQTLELSFLTFPTKIYYIYFILYFILSESVTSFSISSINI